MNFTIKPVIRLDKITKKTGEAPVCIRLTKNGQNTYKTIFRINPQYWDEKKQCVKKSHPNELLLNTTIKNATATINDKALQVVNTSDEFGVNRIRNKIHTNTSTIDFFEYNYVDRYELICIYLCLLFSQLF